MGADLLGGIDEAQAAHTSSGSRNEVGYQVVAAAGPHIGLLGYKSRSHRVVLGEAALLEQSLH